MHLGSWPPWYVLALAALVTLLVLAALALGLATRWVAFWRRRLKPPVDFDEVFETRTRDGATLVLGRIRPVGSPSSLPPIVFCHGLAMNRYALALDPQRSLARAFAARGRDCWLLELRGASLGRFSSAARAATFDTYASHDIPTALAYVTTATGAERVDWVGFSMGGMLAYAHLGALHGDSVRRLVTLGSPVRFKGYPAARAMGAAPYVFTPFGLRIAAPFGWLATSVAPLLWPGLPLFVTRGFRGHHYDREALRSIFGASFSDVPAGVMKQFARWVREDSLTSDDGARDYRAGLATITVPTLVISGDRDRLALPPCVREAYERIGAAEKKYRDVGPASGAHAHYDHLDLIMGAKAYDEVFADVFDWLGRA